MPGLTRDRHQPRDRQPPAPRRPERRAAPHGRGSSHGTPRAPRQRQPQPRRAAPSTGTVVAAARARFAARRRRTRWQSARPAVLGTALVALLAGTAWLVLASPVFAVDRVEVRGVARLTAADVLAAARVGSGTPLARVDLPAVRHRVAALAPVASVRVERDWPHTLQVVVRERVAVATIRASAGVVLLDQQGVPFGTQSRAPKGTVQLRVSGPVPGEGQASARAALAVWRTLPARIRSAVTALGADSPRAVTLTLRGGRAVVWGAPTDGERKARVLAALLARPARVYDVSAPGVAVTR